MADRDDARLAEDEHVQSFDAGDVPFENEDRIGQIPVVADGIRDRVSGGPVLKHVQNFADALCRETGACAISTYDGHDPHKSRALDILVSSAYGVWPSDFSRGDEVAEFTLNAWSSYRVMYVIWKQMINSKDGRGWRNMEDRGSITQNHFDHCHVSFLDGDGGDGGDALPLMMGSIGPRVGRLQTRLNEFGANLSVDSDFGPLTHGAVVQFQAGKGLDQDGIVGQNTSVALGFGWPW